MSLIFGLPGEFPICPFLKQNSFGGRFLDRLTRAIFRPLDIRKSLFSGFFPPVPRPCLIKRLQFGEVVYDTSLDNFAIVAASHHTLREFAWHCELWRLR